MSLGLSECALYVRTVLCVHRADCKSFRTPTKPKETIRIRLSSVPPGYTLHKMTSCTVPVRSASALCSEEIRPSYLYSVSIYVRNQFGYL